MAPLEKDNVHRVLDIGTGTGIWAIEMAEIFHNAEVTGIDLSGTQPSWVPPNVKFIIDDIESPWIENDIFDFIMCRYMVSSIKDWPKLVENMYDHLNPGGWVELQDICVESYSQDGTLTKEHALIKWNKAYEEASEIIGRDCKPGKKLKGWIEDAGFENIHHERFRIPIGPWPKDPYYRDIGIHNLIQYLDGLEGFSLRSFCGALGWTQEEVLVLLAEVRNELKSGAYHAMFDFHVVYGQKPKPKE
ncbi:Phosphoethanolamine N-methyltransferase 3-like protein 2 [Colletotrichum chlorophyti]|uniref:Phosphoethanolamine N-methyltransferase 3-like protein 2 n=1 Tax=Colletotrichum chlorophyti TaxID=708187 RepID=A0A1Q8RTU4_9PEZI|nr:Phosphoethanolamine N-methyltransferase 3-like protein 2 [Colletotrichum chlorophyti]